MFKKHSAPPIVKKVPPKPVHVAAPKIIEEPFILKSGPGVGLRCSTCGKPVAEGQTEVCKEHIRRG